ncbi:MAG TPA: type I-D CRISPR-associated endonuclease Cas1d [Chloroflexota bacterium]|nr:type I-D CRISPR-associated endonuclease Cas1d [Chloroflexota bacterium]
MSTLYLTEQRSVVQKDGDVIVVRVPEDARTGQKARKVEVPMLKIDRVVVVGNVTLTMPLIHAFLESQIDVCLLSYHGRFRGRLSGEFSKNAPLRIAQHRAAADFERSLDLARRFVVGKLVNLRTTLLRHNRKADDPAVARAAAQLKAAVDSAEDARDPDQLRGIEGSASAAYFGVFDRLIRSDSFAFEKRTRRPPTDPVNALLSFGYALLTGDVGTAVNVVGLDPYVAFLHVAVYGRPALALDLMEEFRPLIVDSVVLRMVNNGEIKPDDFVDDLGSYRLTDGARKQFLLQYETRLGDEISHPTFEYKATYRRCLELQARLLAKTLTGEIPDYPEFVTR